jgi:hypothetical protein
MTTCQNLFLSPVMGGDPRGPRGNGRSQTGIKFDLAQFLLPLPENACFTVAGAWSRIMLPPKFPVRPHDSRGPRPRTQSYCRLPVVRTDFVAEAIILCNSTSSSQIDSTLIFPLPYSPWGFSLSARSCVIPSGLTVPWPGPIAAATAAASHPTNEAQFMFGNGKAPENTGPGAEHKSLRKGTYGALSTE